MMFDKHVYKITRLSAEGQPAAAPFIGGNFNYSTVEIPLDPPLKTKSVAFQTNRAAGTMGFVLGEVTKVGETFYIENIAPVLSDPDRDVEHYELVPLTLGTWRTIFPAVDNWQELDKQIESDDELVNFYLQEFGVPSASLFEEISFSGIFWNIEEAAAYPAGTIRRRADGYDWEKQIDGTWKRVTKTKDKLSLVGPVFSSKDLEDPLPDPHAEWKDKADNLPENTFDSFYEDVPGFEDMEPGLRPKQLKADAQERRLLHEKIIRTFLRNKTPAPKDQPPHAVVTLGVPAAGKSTAIARVIADKHNYVHVDPDQIKVLLPEYKQAKAQNARNAASIVHLESGEIAERIRDEALARRMNLIFEGVGRDQEYYADMVSHMRDVGHKVHLVLAHLPDVNEAIRRAEDRGKRVGRVVPTESIQDAHKNVPKTFEKLRKDAKDFLVIDGRTGTTAWSRTNGQESIESEDIFENITGKKPPQEEAKESEGLSTEPDELNALLLQAFKYEEQIIEALPARYDAERAITEPTEEPYRLCCKGKTQ